MPATEQKTRVAWGTISREQVIETATRMIRETTLEQVTIRRLASELGVAPMSLYRHVRDKDDLLDEVVDRLLARRWRPRADPAEWKQWMSECAERFRDFLVRQPAALQVYLGHPVVRPVAMQRMETSLEVLTGAGLDDRAAVRAYGTIHTYTIGFAALEASRARDAGSVVDRGPIGSQLASFTTVRQFREGLGFLLDGIDRQLPAPR